MQTQRKSVDKRDKHLPQTFEQLIQMYNLERISQYFNGELIESGRNNNGDYIKYSDGTMICTKQVSITANIIDSWGNIYDTGNQNIDLGNYAQAFIDIPKVSITMASANGCWVEGCSNRNKVSFGKIVLASATSKEAQVVYDLIAIGRWK